MRSGIDLLSDFNLVDVQLPDLRHRPGGHDDQAPGGPVPGRERQGRDARHRHLRRGHGGGYVGRDCAAPRRSVEEVALEDTAVACAADTPPDADPDRDCRRTPDDGRGRKPLPQGAGDLLVATGCTKRFGGLVAVSDIDFTIPRGGIVSLIGPNGAGKTTFFNMITGLYVPTEGSIMFDGTELTGRKPHEVVRLGIARTFQNIRLFGNMTAEDNVLVGLHHRLKGRWFGAILRPPSIQREEAEAHARAMELLDLVGLERTVADTGPQPAVRRPAPARDRPGAGHRAQAPAARRADRRHEPRGDPPADRLRPRAA